MAITIGSAALSDEAFLRAFGTGELPTSSFRHGDHLRLAWLRLDALETDDAITQVRRDIERFAISKGAGHIYHVTITTAWVRLLATHSEPTFDEFIAANQHRLTHHLLHRFWTPDLLSSQKARSAWVEPDRQALPTC